MKHLISCNQLDIMNLSAHLTFYNNMIEMTGTTKSHFIDRTGVVDSPLRINVPQTHQLHHGCFDRMLDFEDCYRHRISQLVTCQDRLDKPMILTYSGGLDSTAILCAFIKELGIKEASRRVIVMLDSASIYESPDFYLRWIAPHFDMVPTSSLDQYWPPTAILIDGEPNGLIVQSEYVLRIGQKLGAEILEQKFCYQTLDKLFQVLSRSNYEPTHIDVFSHMINQTALRVGVTIDCVMDMIWWLNLNFRWMYYAYMHIRRFRIYRSDIRIDQQFINDHFWMFYGSTEWQSWSHAHRLDQISYARSHGVKPPTRQYIYQVTGDQTYLALKRKVHSLGNACRLEPFYWAVNDQFDCVPRSQQSSYIRTSDFLSQQGILAA